MTATWLHMLQRIDKVYTLRHKVPVTFQHCFKTPLQVFQEKSDNYLQNWLTLYEQLILHAALDPKRQQNITEFFLFYNKFMGFNQQISWERERSGAAYHGTIQPKRARVESIGGCSNLG